jgi:hypothetical protein
VRSRICCGVSGVFASSSRVGSSCAGVSSGLLSCLIPHSHNRVSRSILRRHTPCQRTVLATLEQRICNASATWLCSSLAGTS